MKGMLNIASAGAVDLGTAADITSNILRGFGMQAAESERLGDVLTNTFTNSSTNLSQLGETMKYVAPIARATNVSLETTAAAAGLLGNAGIKGEQAGTALRAMLTRLAAPVHKAQIVLGQLGVKTKDAHGNMRPLADTLADLNAKMAKYGNGTRQAMTSSIFGMEAATAATVLLGEAGSGSLQKFTEAVKRTGTAQGIADKANATMAGQWDNLKGSVEVLAIKIGEALIPSLKRLIDKIVPVVNNVTEWMKKNPQLTDTVVKVGAAVSVTTLALTAAAFAFRGAKLAILATEGAMLLLNKATWKAAGAWAAANAPILFAAIGIAGLAIAAYSVYEAWNPVSQWFAELWDDALDGLGRYLGAIKTLAKVAQFIPGMSGLSGAVALIPDIGTDHRGARNRRFNEEAFNRLAPYSSLGGPMREDQKPWSMFDGADKLKSGGSGDITVHAPINITLPTGTPDETRKAIEGASKMGARELGDLLKRVFAESARTSLD
jgi:TP901 family phage tail tape measure protein